MIDFLDELCNFKQKKFYTSKCKIFLYFKATDSYLTFEFALSFTMLKHQQHPMFPSGLPSTAPPVPKWSLQWESGANPCGPAMKWESGANPCGAAMQCTLMGTLNLGSNTLKP